MTNEVQAQSTYPVRLDIDYAGSDRNRLTNFFRTITAIPILVLVATFGTGTKTVIVIPTLLMILFRQKYPR